MSVACLDKANWYVVLVLVRKQLEFSSLSLENVPK